MLLWLVSVCNKQTLHNYFYFLTCNIMINCKEISQLYIFFVSVSTVQQHITIKLFSCM